MVTVSLDSIIFQESHKFFLLVPIAIVRGYPMKNKMLVLFLSIKLANPKSLQIVTGSWVLLALLVVRSCD